MIKLSVIDRALVALWLATVAVFLSMVFISIPEVVFWQPELKIFDARFCGYSIHAAREFLQAIGPEGREVYRGSQRYLDTVFPALFSCALVWSFLRCMPMHWGAWRLLPIVLSVLVGVFDYLENSAVQTMLTMSVESLPEAMVQKASFYTQTKYVLFAVTTMVFIYCMARAYIIKNTSPRYSRA